MYQSIQLSESVTYPAGMRTKLVVFASMAAAKLVVFDFDDTLAVCTAEPGDVCDAVFGGPKRLAELTAFLQALHALPHVSLAVCSYNASAVLRPLLVEADLLTCFSDICGNEDLAPSGRLHVAIGGTYECMPATKSELISTLLMPAAAAIRHQNRSSSPEAGAVSVLFIDDSGVNVDEVAHALGCCTLRSPEGGIARAQMDAILSWACTGAFSVSHSAGVDGSAVVGTIAGVDSAARAAAAATYESSAPTDSTCTVRTPHISLWLMPPELALADLTACIAYASELGGGPVFAAHATLLGSVGMDAADAMARLAELRGTGGIPLSFEPECAGRVLT